jgi:hypothetical protein
MVLNVVWRPTLLFFCTLYHECQPMTRGPGTAPSRALCGTLNASVSNLNLGPSLGYGKSGRTPQDPQFEVMLFVASCGYGQFYFVEHWANYLVDPRCQIQSIKQMAKSLRYFNKTTVSYLRVVSDCTQKSTNIIDCAVWFWVGDIARRSSNRIPVRNCVETKVQSFSQNTRQLDLLSKFEL